MNQTYNGNRFTIEAVPGGAMYIRANDRNGFVSRVRNPRISTSLGIQARMVEEGRLPASRLRQTVDKICTVNAQTEAQNGNPVAVAEAGTLAQVVVDTSTGIVINPTNLNGRDRVGRY